MASLELEELERQVLKDYEDFWSRGIQAGMGPILVATGVSRKTFYDLFYNTSAGRARILFRPEDGEMGSLYFRGDNNHLHGYAQEWLGDVFRDWKNQTGLDTRSSERLVDIASSGALIEYAGRLEQVDFCILERGPNDRNFLTSRPVFVGEVCYKNETEEDCAETVDLVVESGVARVAMGIIIRIEDDDVFTVTVVFKQEGSSAVAYKVNEQDQNIKIEIPPSCIFCEDNVLAQLDEAVPITFDLVDLRNYVMAGVRNHR